MQAQPVLFPEFEQRLGEPHTATGFSPVVLEEAPAEILALPHVRALFVSCFAMTAAHGALNIFYTLYLDARTGVLLAAKRN